jgi:hypothetical protein
MKLDRAGGIAREHAVEHQRVDVDVQIEGAAKALDDRDSAALRLLGASGARVVPQHPEYGSEEDCGHTREPARQEPAPEKGPKRALDELRHTLAVAHLGRLGQERLEVILHDPVKHAVGGAAWFVARGRSGHPARIAEAVPASRPHVNRPKPIGPVGGDRADCAV